jgi:hypothetical protein
MTSAAAAREQAGEEEDGGHRERALRGLAEAGKRGVGGGDGDGEEGG